MELGTKATRIELFKFGSVHTRCFHLSWLAFFVSFFGWFGIAPLMAVIREDLNLSKAQVGNTLIASVAATIAARFLIGPLCDHYGPRKVYTALLLICAIPVLGVSLAQSYEQFLLFRLAIGVIGASFVVTQYHSSMMFAPNVIGTANATAAGWGNLGGGMAQILMPVILATLMGMGVEARMGWRLSMLVPGVLLVMMAALYWRYTQDAPEGNFAEIRAQAQLKAPKSAAWASFKRAAQDYRAWTLFLVYGACFGAELTMHNLTALYFFDRFDLSLGAAGLLAGGYGVMNLFTRSLGGVLSDRCAGWMGLSGRVYFLALMMLCAGVSMMLFAQMEVLGFAIVALLLLALFAQMASGATYGLVPFVNRQALGGVAGIVGAGGNAGAVAMGFLFKSDALNYAQALSWVGVGLLAAAVTTLLIRFSTEVVQQETGMNKALA